MMTIFEITIWGIDIAPTYYGLMYAVSFLLAYKILLKRKIVSVKHLDDLFFLVFVWVILGGRLGYILFYNFEQYISNPIEILKIWEGGMSFHGGLLGVVLAILFFTKKHKINFLQVIDEVARVVPIWILLWRFGNYLNKELLGGEYSGFLAVEIEGKTYFPAPLLEAFLEGVVLYFILEFVAKRKKIRGEIWAYFLIFYAIFRIFVEFIRTPDTHIGYISWWTMGQILTFPMLIIGIFLLFYLRKWKQG